MPKTVKPARAQKTEKALAETDHLALEPGLLRGTVEHYEDPILYDHEYKRRREDVNYYRALAADLITSLPGASGRNPNLGRGPGDVLELGCGSGRLLLPLVKDGVRVVGVDLSRPMLRRCAERLARLSPAVRERAVLLRADFRRLSLGRRFPLIVTPFNAMQHLYTRSDVERFLDVVRAHLAPGGTFAFDVMNPDLAWLVRNPLKHWARTRFKDPQNGQTYYYSTNHAYDAATQINWIRLYYEEAPNARSRDSRDLSPPGKYVQKAPASRARAVRGAGGQAPAVTVTGKSPPRVGPIAPRLRVVHLAQRMFFPEDLAAILHYNGFSVDQRDGGFQGERFEAESDSQVCRCSIRAPSRR